MRSPDFLVVGAGIFGVASALELRRRGHAVALVDPGPLPHPLAASTDVSKIVRMEYGSDEEYMALVETAIDGWERWNEELGETLYHPTGVAMLTRSAMAPGGFEHESFRLLLARGHRPERLDAAAIARRFPAWRPSVFVDGFFHARAGWAESGRVVARLVAEARRQGVDVRGDTAVAGLVDDGGQVVGVRTRDGDRLDAGTVVVAAGAWTPWLLPELQPLMKATGHPVFHLRPADPEPFRSPAFAVFTADISRSGWYGFPLHPSEGIVKVANHGPGLRLHPEHDPRVVTAEDERALRAFLAELLPSLADAPIVFTRRCVYTDTLDGHFLIDHHPGRDGLVVASGGSGHGFKMAPVLGGLVADAAEGKVNPWTRKFRWRSLDAATRAEEEARYRG